MCLSNYLKKLYSISTVLLSFVPVIGKAQITLWTPDVVQTVARYDLMHRKLEIEKVPNNILKLKEAFQIIREDTSNIYNSDDLKKLYNKLQYELITVLGYISGAVSLHSILPLPPLHFGVGETLTRLCLDIANPTKEGAKLDFDSEIQSERFFLLAEILESVLKRHGDHYNVVIGERKKPIGAFPELKDL